MYVDLLRMVLESETGWDSRPTPELVEEVEATRQRLRLSRAEPPEAAVADGFGPAGPIGDALAYDAALVRLCERLGVAHRLTEDAPGSGARQDAEKELTELVPRLAPAPDPSRAGHGTDPR